MSRLESGKISVRLDWCEINDLLNKVIKVLKQELEQFRLVISIPEEMPLVRLDFGLMEQVIYNLILNSCQHSPAASSIRFESCYEEGFLKIEIEDNGPGFPPELLTKVFNKFFRVDNSRAGGLGLGLSIVKGLVEAHKGTVRVENKNAGGAKFTITIPTEIPDMKKIKLE
jgi:two-component system sensor histidine kinase KdpD